MWLCSARLDSGRLEPGPGSLCPTWARGRESLPHWARGRMSLPPTWARGRVSLPPTWARGVGLWYTQQATARDCREMPCKSLLVSRLKLWRPEPCAEQYLEELSADVLPSGCRLNKNIFDEGKLRNCRFFCKKCFSKVFRLKGDRAR